MVWVIDWGSRDPPPGGPRQDQWSSGHQPRGSSEPAVDNDSRVQECADDSVVEGRPGPRGRRRGQLPQLLGAPLLPVPHVPRQRSVSLSSYLGTPTNKWGGLVERTLANDPQQKQTNFIFVIQTSSRLSEKKYCERPCLSFL